MTYPDSFSNKRKKVCIQGLGFVGSAMALAVAMARTDGGAPLYDVIGVDLPTEGGMRIVKSFNEGIFPFENNDHKLSEAMTATHKEGNIYATTSSDFYSIADIIIVDINLDILYNGQEPALNMNPFTQAINMLGDKVKEGVLIIVETTVPPGTCQKIIYPILKEKIQNRGLSVDNIYLAHSYERVMPGENYFDSIVNFWRVYSGINEKSAEACRCFLETVISTKQYPLTKLENTTSTETAKVLENSYRATNIAFIEEWGRFAESVGIDLYEVIDAIRMRPTHSNIRQPGFGVGGYCLTKDPYFAYLSAKDIFGIKGLEFPYSTSAVRINNHMPIVSLDKIERTLGGDLKGCRILVLGISYREDVGDTRYSPSQIFVEEAIKRGALVTCQDPLVSEWKETHIEVIRDIPSFSDYDAIVFTVPHKQYKKIKFDDSIRNRLVFDANKVLSYDQIEQIHKISGSIFESIGRGNM